MEPKDRPKRSKRVSVDTSSTGLLSSEPAKPFKKLSMDMSTLRVNSERQNFHFRRPSPPPIRVTGVRRNRASDHVCLSPGYESYSKKLMLLQLPTEYDTGNHDDLSADEAYEIAPIGEKKNSNWRKVRNVVQWTPFIQTYKRHKYPWVQLAGHQGNFKAGYKQGTIMKKLCLAEEKALNAIMNDVLKPYVPAYMGVEEASDGERYLSLQDLLSAFTAPCVMDVKMGVRTYLEEELAKARHNPKLRKDMYEKMIQIDPNAPTEAERKAKAVTKPRYMVWRETISSTSTLGFRIEGVRRSDGSSSKDFKTTKSRDQVSAAFMGFMKGYPHARAKYCKKLKEIKEILEKSTFFMSHELIGSSLLFVHSESEADVWLIDFAKTCPLPGGVHITHRNPWVEGTHEDGYLIGLENLSSLIESSIDKTDDKVEVDIKKDDLIQNKDDLSQNRSESISNDLAKLKINESAGILSKEEGKIDSLSDASECTVQSSKNSPILSSICKELEENSSLEKSSKGSQHCDKQISNLKTGTQCCSGEEITGKENIIDPTNTENLEVSLENRSVKDIIGSIEGANKAISSESNVKNKEIRSITDSEAALVSPECSIEILQEEHTATNLENISASNVDGESELTNTCGSQSPLKKR